MNLEVIDKNRFDLLYPEDRMQHTYFIFQPYGVMVAKYSANEFGYILHSLEPLENSSYLKKQKVDLNNELDINNLEKFNISNINIKFKSMTTFGTSFQKRVWDTSRNIKPGKVVTYGDLAREIGNNKASRAVGTALGSNKFAVLIPCHRIVPKSGGVGKFGWGSDTKLRWLQLEGASGF